MVYGFVVIFPSISWDELKFRYLQYVFTWLNTTNQILCSKHLETFLTDHWSPLRKHERLPYFGSWTPHPLMPIVLQACIVWTCERSGAFIAWPGGPWGACDGNDKSYFHIIFSPKFGTADQAWQASVWDLNFKTFFRHGKGCICPSTLRIHELLEDVDDIALPQDADGYLHNVESVHMYQWQLLGSTGCWWTSNIIKYHQTSILQTLCMIFGILLECDDLQNSSNIHNFEPGPVHQISDLPIAWGICSWPLRSTMPSCPAAWDWNGPEGTIPGAKAGSTENTRPNWI